MTSSIISEKKPALICDLDGTLIDSNQDIAIAVAFAINQVTDKKCTPEDLYPWMGRGLIAMFAHFLPEIEMGGKEFMEGVKHYQGFYKENCNVHTTVFPTVIPTLESLKERGIKLAIASNKWSVIARHVCEKMGLAQYFLHFQGIENTPGKPKPDVILKSCKAIEVKPDQAVYVGDKVLDIQAGQNAGCTTVAVGYGGDQKELLSDHQPDLLIDRFEQILSLFE